MEKTCFLSEGGRCYSVHRNKSMVNIYCKGSITASFSIYPCRLFALCCFSLCLGKLPSVNCTSWNPFPSVLVLVGLGNKSSDWRRKRDQSNYFLFPFPARLRFWRWLLLLRCASPVTQSWLVSGDNFLFPIEAYGW